MMDDQNVYIPNMPTQTAPLPTQYTVPGYPPAPLTVCPGCGRCRYCGQPAVFQPVVVASGYNS